MSQVERLTQLLTDIGPAMQLAGVYEIEEGREWELSLAEGVSIGVQYEESDDRLTFTLDVIDFPQAPPTDLMVRMLQYNAATMATGGVRLALSTDFTVLLIYDLPGATLTHEGLKTVVLVTADMAAAWRQGISELINKYEPAVPSGIIPDHEAVIIR